MTDYEALRPYATPRQAEILDALYTAGSSRKAAKLLGISDRRIPDALARLRKEAARRGHAPDHDMRHPVAPGFEVKGTSTLYSQSGQVVQQWVKTRADAGALQELLQGFTEELVDRAQGKAMPTPAPKLVNDASLMSAYVVGDAHVGMYAHGDETGGDDFDTSIAVRELRGAFRHLTAASPASEIGMLVNVGDWMHANDTTSTTQASKNVLDTDGRYSQVIDRACEIFYGAVSMMLRKHREVWIVNARGNHDPDAAMWLNKVLQAYYSNEPRVRIIPNVGKFIYVEWGKTLIGVHHGDQVKRQQLYEAMTRDKREEWGRAKHAYFWTGHIHHKAAEEIGGCLFESFNTLAPVDAWHAANGYGANREMQQITLHREFGIVGRNVCAVEMARLAA